MVCLKSTVVLALCAGLTAAGPIVARDQALEKRQGTANVGSVTCGDNSYSRQQLEEAAAEGCRLHAANQQVGASEYPHRFNNRENLSFATSGPFQEFPIIPSGNYTGRSPGPDRVVLDPNYRGSCVYVGTMTHTGASGRNGFVSCNQTKSSGSNGTSAAATLVGSGSLGAAVCILSLLTLTAW
ncbi:guanyl-specific ribonuclease F1 [Colletotrichum spaethianum]|uniref:Guanyl-specific ribonuclease F1 n=1 Tax=Colletotrichum spaethianum TaxID=700344 RepID=A0AA37L416_9PEZI|nr:guanyl-specific ribonuclease F1 [Colletotrichum spaethianum]GKT41591.1 guanyl-specific ribonuclease F1 [Colletotrichum spaethianum]